jgi:hypothetical protein
MGLFFAKVSNPALCELCTNMNLKGLSYSPLPTFIHAHAHHILTTPTMHRAGIDLIPHQLVANKIVCHAQKLYFSMFSNPLLARRTYGTAKICLARRPRSRYNKQLANVGRAKGSRRLDTKRSGSFRARLERRVRTNFSFFLVKGVTLMMI